MEKPSVVVWIPYKHTNVQRYLGAEAAGVFQGSHKLLQGLHKAHC